jgi:outer membrane immunogenic protein
MKKFVLVGAFALLAGGQALAADLPPPMAPPPRAPAAYAPAPVPYFSWTGIYIGLNAGYGFGTVKNDSFLGVPTGNYNTTGFVGGGTIGGNYQFNSFVVGIEADGDYNGLSGTVPLSGASFTSTYLATVRGRAGFAWDRVLFYGTAGGAATNAKDSIFGTANSFGWTAGGGVEYAFLPNWTAKAEYLYIQTTPSIGGVSITDTENVIRGGINYKFSW